MIRKEFELTRDAAEKLARLAVDRGCSEGYLVEQAIEGMADGTNDLSAWEQRLAAEGLVHLPRPATTEQRRRLAKRERWLAAQPPADLSSTVIADRESGY